LIGSFLVASSSSAQVAETTMPIAASSVPIVFSAAEVPLGVLTNGVEPPTITWLPDEPAEAISGAFGIQDAVTPGVAVEALATNGQSVLTFVYQSSPATIAATTRLTRGASPGGNSPQPLDSVGACVRPGSGLLGWWPAEGTANDSAGGHNGQTPVGFSYAGGEVGQAFSFNGSQSVQVPYASGLMTTGFTIEVWIKPSQQLSSQRFAVGQAYGRQLVLQPGSGGFVNAVMYLTTTNGTFVGTTPVLIPVAQYTHLAATYDAAYLKLYTNGVLARSSAYSAPLGDSLCTWAFGGLTSACGFSGQYLPSGSQIDEVSLYNRALLAGEINAIYLAGAAGKCKTPQSCDPGPFNIAASWPGEGDASDMVNTYPGTLQNGVGFDQGVVARAFTFNPTNQQAVEMTSLSSVLTSPFALEAWIKPLLKLGGSPQQAFILGQSYGSQLVVSNGLLGLRVGFALASSRTVFHEVVSSGDIPLREWSHLVAVYDGSLMSLYINGALDQQTAANITPWDSGCPFHLGGIYDPSGVYAYTGQFFNGLIDEATVYSAALTATDVQALYNAGEMGKCNSLGYWLQYYFGTNCWSQTYATATADADGDGVSNFQHYLDGTDPNKITFSTSVNNEYVTSTSVPVQLSILGGVPFYYAVLLNDTDTTHANWQAYSGPNVNATLGPADGTYSVWVGLKGLPDDAQQTWDGLDLTLDRAGPVLAITNPVLTAAAATVAKPYLQLGGSANEPLGTITYDLVNAAGTIANVDGFVIDQAFDNSRFDYTTTWFQCFDIPLTPGPNSIALHATDRAGNVTTTNITVTLDYSGAAPPVVSVTWPPSDTPLSGPTFYVRGRVSDETASVTAQVVDGANNTTVVDGTVERNGVFWVEDLPLAAGTSTVTLTVTNAAGNVTATSLTVTASDVTLTINSTPSDESLYQATGYVNGYISDPSYAVVVNGKPVSVDQLGAWSANDVPIRGQGTATFDAVATGRTTVATSAKPEMPPYVAIVEYHDNKHANASYSGPPSSSSASSRVKDFTATYQADPSGTRTSTYHGVATDHNSYSPTGGWDNWVFDWSNAGSFTHETASGDPGIDVTWDGIDDRYDHFGQVTGLPDKDLLEAAPGGPAPTWVSHYYASGVHYKWPQPQPAAPSTADVAVSARTRQVLFTGGKSSVGRQNLIHLNAWAEQYGQPIIGPWQHTPNQLVDPRKIQMLGHSLGRPNPDGTGDLYLALPDNASKELNLSISGAKHYNAAVTSVQKHKLFVQANNYLLAPDRVRPDAHYCVGQGLTFTPAFVPELPDVSEKHVQWMPIGNYVNKEDPSPLAPEGSPFYRVDVDLLAQEGALIWWVGGSYKPTELHINVRENVTFANGQYVSLPATGRFTMHRPRLSSFEGDIDHMALVLLHKHPAGESRFTIYGFQDALWVYPQAWWAVDVQAIAPFSGLAGSTQTVEGRMGTDSGMKVNTDSPALDGNEEFYYALEVMDSESDYTASVYLKDDPISSMNGIATWGTMHLDFSDYIRFQPTVGPGPNIFVTLGLVEWHVNGDTTLLTVPGTTNVDFTPQTTDPIPPDLIPAGEAHMDDLVDFDMFPYWIHVIPE
jgi:hypothetical protein